MVNYSNGKVYKIEPICEHDECDVYFGSTTKQYLSQRMDGHRGDFKRNAFCSSKILFEKFGVENCVIILLELVNCNSNDELKVVEAKYIINNACVNKSVPLRTHKESVKIYRDANKNKTKQYYDDNKDKMKEYQRQYCATNAEKIKENQRQYRLKNKDKINERNRQYRLKQKEQSNAENN